MNFMKYVNYEYATTPEMRLSFVQSNVNYFL